MLSYHGPARLGRGHAERDQCAAIRKRNLRQSACTPTLGAVDAACQTACVLPVWLDGAEARSACELAHAPNSAEPGPAPTVPASIQVHRSLLQKTLTSPSTPSSTSHPAPTHHKSEGTRQLSARLAGRGLMIAGHAPYSCSFSVNVRYSSLAERFSARPNQIGQQPSPERTASIQKWQLTPPVPFVIRVLARGAACTTTAKKCTDPLPSPPTARLDPCGLVATSNSLKLRQR